MLTVRAGNVLEGTKIGDSIAVNGVCLTVTALIPGRFSADIMHETLNRSSLAVLSCGSHVNLERAMAADGRFGGHIVSGHIDGTGKIIRVRRDDTAVWFTVRAAPALLCHIVEKGSVAVDGISLTVASVGPDVFNVSAIPHTVRYTVLRERAAGSIVNLETDLIGKYIQKRTDPAPTQRNESSITREFLTKCGF